MRPITIRFIETVEKGLKSIDVIAIPIIQFYFFNKVSGEAISMKSMSLLRRFTPRKDGTKYFFNSLIRLIPIMLGMVIHFVNLLANDLIYIHPLPNSRLVSPATTLILRFQQKLPLKEPHHVQFHVIGNISREHNGEIMHTPDHRTLIFKPHTKFQLGERVSVSIESLTSFVDTNFSFIIAPEWLNDDPSVVEKEEEVVPRIQTTLNNEIRVIQGVSIPNDFPLFTVDISTSPEKGNIFISNQKFIMILNNEGAPLFYRKSISKFWDFTLQPNGVLSCVIGATPRTLDDHFELMNIYKCGHGYKTDHHEFRLLPNGNALLIAEDIQTFNMSELVSGGRESTDVVGNHIQEVDQNQNVIFEWKCWDHYNILDALHENLKNTTIHFVHMNSIDVDYDGHILVSCRHLDEITKINRETGEIIWRFGGQNNQFEFINDPEGFTYQHDFRAVPGKPDHYTLFDNGNFHIPRFSRALEYRLNTRLMTAEKIWAYPNGPYRYAYWMGNVQRLANGNTVIGWSQKILPKITEVTSEDSIVYEGDFYNSYTCYRVHRFNWMGKAIRPYLLLDPSFESQVTLIFNQFGDSSIKKYYIYADTIEYPITRIDSSINPYIHLTRLKNNTTYFFRVTGVDLSGIESEFSNQVETLVQDVDPASNLILNGDFSQGFHYWDLYQTASCSVIVDINQNEQCHTKIFTTNGFDSDIQVYQKHVELIQGRSYQLTFDAYGAEDRIIEVKLVNNEELIDYSKIGYVALKKQKETFTYEFNMDEPSNLETELIFKLGRSDIDVYLDNVILQDVVTHVDETMQTVLPVNYCLNQNYPNPFNNITTIRYRLGYLSDVKIAVFDIRGCLVERRYFRKQEAGEHQYLFNNSYLSSGLYICHLAAQSLVNAQFFKKRLKLICIK